MKNLHVSVVVPTYHRPRLLDRLLRSVAAQTFRRYEVVVVDDHSPDLKAYSGVIQKHRRKIKNLRFLRNEANQGAPHCRNRGILASKHPLVALADDDDEWLPEKLEKQVGVFERRWDEFELVYTSLSFQDEKKIIRHPPRRAGEGVPLREALSGRMPMYSSTLLFKKKALVDIGLFDEKFPSCQDWELCVRFFSAGYRCFPVREELVVYHAHEDTITNSPKRYLGLRMLIRKHFFLYLKRAPLALARLSLMVLKGKAKLHLLPRFQGMKKRPLS